MKVRVLTKFPWSFGYGGAEIQAQKYVEYGKKYGLDIEFMDNYDKSCEYDILHIVGMDYNSYRYVETAKNKDKKVVVSPVYYATSAKANILKYFIKLSGGITYFNHIRMKKALLLADAILPNSLAEQKQLKYIYGLGEKSKFHVVYNGIDYTPMEAITDKLFREQYAINQDYFVTVAMVDKRKNTINLIKGFLEANSRAILVLIGDIRETDTQFISDFNGYLERYPNRIKHIPFIHDKQILNSAYYGACAHIMPSFFETPGLSNLEAGVLGCNLIVGECDPVREYLGDYPTYVEPGDINSIALAVKSNEGRQVNNKMSDYIKRYYWENIVQDLIKIYEKL